MIRVPDNVCKVIDTFAGHTHSSRPDVVIDACRQFYVAICSKEAAVMDAADRSAASKEAARTFYNEEVRAFIKEYRDDYEASLEKSNGNISILVVFPVVLLEKINRIVTRTKQFRNHQDYFRVSLAYLFVSERALMAHEDRMDAFFGPCDIEDEMNRMRELMRGSGDSARRGDDKWRMLR